MIDFTSGIFIGALIGFILALPASLFLAFWLSVVKSRTVVVIGSFIGALIAFLAILAWVSLGLNNNTTGVATFFGALFACSTAGLSLAILTDLFIANIRSRNYQPVTQEGHE